MSLSKKQSLRERKQSIRKKRHNGQRSRNVNQEYEYILVPYFLDTGETAYKRKKVDKMKPTLVILYEEGR